MDFPSTSSSNAKMIVPITEFSNYLTLFQYVIVAVVYAISLQVIVHILYALYRKAKSLVLKEKNGLSNLLIANLVCWTILMGSAIPHVLWMIVNWRPNGRTINPYTIFWTTILTECMMAMIPYSLVFLTVDRIFSIELLTKYEEHHRIKMLLLCVITLFGIFVINIVAFMQIMPLGDSTDCNVFACLMTNGNTTFIVSKLFGGVLIIFTGAYFLVKLRKRKLLIKASMQVNPAANGNQQNKIEPDTLVTLMICTELGLNFLPQLIIFIIQQIIHHQIASDIGPINHFLNSFDALISALTYRHTLRRFINIGGNNGTSTESKQQRQHQNMTNGGGFRTMTLRRH